MIWSVSSFLPPIGLHSLHLFFSFFFFLVSVTVFHSLLNVAQTFNFWIFYNWAIWIGLCYNIKSFVITMAYISSVFHFFTVFERSNLRTTPFSSISHPDPRWLVRHSFSCFSFHMLYSCILFYFSTHHWTCSMRKELQYQLFQICRQQLCIHLCVMCDPSFSMCDHH